MDSVKTEGNDDWIYPLIINGAVIPVKLGTGSEVNMLSEEDYCQLKKQPQIHPTHEKLRGYYQNEIPIKGKCIAEVRSGQRNQKMVFHVVPGKAQPLLSKAACLKLRLIRLVYAPDTPPKEDNSSDYSDVMTEYADVFEGLGCLPGKHVIVVDENVQPVVHPCRKVPFALHEKLKTELERMESLGVTTKVDEPMSWVNSLVVVRKQNGDIRICMDARDLNRAIKREHYQMPTREEIMLKFVGAKYFSKLDASQGFRQVQLDMDSSHLCTFTSPFDRYPRLPFGISSAPEV